MRRSGVVLSLLLGMSLGGCGGCNQGELGKKELEEKEKPTNSGIDEKELQEALAGMDAYLEKIHRARAGETVDFYGDGSTYRQWTDANGVRHVEDNGPPHRPARAVVEKWPNGYYKRTFSEYGDGIIDKQEEIINGKRIELFDTDRDGVFDKRVTSKGEAGNPEFFRVIEQKRVPTCPRDDDEACWETPPVRDDLMPIWIESLPNNAKIGDDKIHSKLEEAPFFFENPTQAWEGADAFQVEDVHAFTLITSPIELGIQFIKIGDGHCTESETLKVMMAVSKILNKSLKCLQETNPAMAKKINETLESGNHRVNFHCGFENDPYVGNKPSEEQPLGYSRGNKYEDGKWTYECTAAPSCTIKINREQLLRDAPPNELQETVLHELLHTLGFDNDDPNHDQGTSKTAACSRYCSDCSKRSEGASESPGVDCARCANTPEEKMKCGWKISYPFGTPTAGPPGCNTQQISESKYEGVACYGSSRLVEYFFCDDSTYQETDALSQKSYEAVRAHWYCCETCPCVTNCLITSNNNNGAPCRSSKGGPLPFPPGTSLDPDLCDRPPPFCR
ncbi:MAG: hypothetical protein FWD46_02865 [Cystobacterineae bacterium]|nr:hypothetical protein [Cystobacterineae bacterium]